MTGPIDLSGRVVLVTGGSRGIGAEVAVEAARLGAAVAIGYHASGDAAAAVAARIEAAGGSAATFGADIADAAAVDDLVARVDAGLGPIDGLVNSAAVMSTAGFLETDASEWERTMRIDLDSVSFACRAVLPGMVEGRRGAIVNVTSRLAAIGSDTAAAYAAAKAGVASLTQSLAAEFGLHGVRVNAVAPGTTGTDMGRAIVDSPEGRERAQRIPLRRFVEPKEVAAAILFLLSEAASGITGQTLHVNGGELMS